MRNEYAELKQRVQQAGLLEKRPYAALTTILRNFVLLALCFTIFALTRNLWVVALNAVFLSLISGQFAFVMHDAGHRQLWRRGWQNVLVGMIHGNLILGISYGHWVRKHNKHHANPNHADLDPDIDIPVLAFSEEQALEKRGLARLIVKYQAYLFFPMLLFQGINMHVYTIYSLAKERTPLRWLEGWLMVGHWALIIGLPLYFLGVWPTVVIVLIWETLTGLYMASVFAPNHKGMLVVEEGMELDFLRSQVLTARNVKSHPFTDFWYGGLNYQIEHHLFPTLPRTRLRQAQAIIKQFCAERNISYYETSIIGSYREILQYLHIVSAPLRAPATVKSLGSNRTYIFA